MIPHSTLYKLVDAEALVIIAEGSKAAMHKLMKEKKRETGKRYFIVITTKKIGEQWFNY